jgi:hypothetical protein
MLGLLALPTFVFGMLGRINADFALDSATFAMNAGELADATLAVADAVPMVERWISRAAVAGPYTPLIAVGLKTGVQLAVNHGKMKPVVELGAVSREQLVADFEKWTEQQQR